MTRHHFYEGSSGLTAWNMDPTVGILDLMGLNPAGNGRAYLYRTPLTITGSVGYLRVRVSLP